MTPLILAALHVNTADVQDLWWDGEILWAATTGGLEAWSESGERLGHLLEGLPESTLTRVGDLEGDLVVGTSSGGAARWRPDPEMGEWEAISAGSGALDDRIVAVLSDQVVTAGGLLFPSEERLPGTAADAVSFDGAVIVGTLEAELHVWKDGVLTTSLLPGPVRDMEVVGDEVRIACGMGAAVYNGELQWLDMPATAAGAVWGTRDGLLIEDGRVIGRVPSAVTALEPVGDSWAVGTADGLYLVDDESVRLTPEGQICGNFLTGATRWKGRIAVSTFDRGACVLEDDGWHPIEGLPTEMVNDILGDGETLWLATSDGLVAWTEHSIEYIGAVDPGTSRRVPGVQHRAVNGLSRGERLWITDVNGPVSVDGQSQWRRHRRAVWGHSYQDIAACGSEAWVASEDAGVSWTNGQRWEHHDASTGLPDDWIMAVTCDGKGRGWAGTYQDGVWVWDGRLWRELPGLSDGWVLSLDWSEEGLWVGTMSGLWLWTAGFQAMPGLPHPAVHDLSATDGEVLIATEGGLAILRRRSG